MPDTTPTSVVPERELTHPLERLRGIIHRFITLDVILFTLLFVSFWFWLGLAFDYGVFKATGLDIAQQLTPLFRVIVLVTLALLLLVMVAIRVRTLLNKDLSYQSLALVLEKRYPQVLGDRLITAIEMADVDRAEKQGYSADLVRHTIAEARERIGQVDVDKVFAWKRLWKKAGVLVLVSAVGLAVAVAAHAIASGGLDARRAGYKFADVAGIWAERNLLVWNTPWPRRAHLVIEEFDDDGHPGEIRVGKGAAIPPKVTARAYRWVVADRGSPDGWRPLTFADLRPHCQLVPPTLTGVSPADMPGKTLDEIEQTHADDPAVQKLFADLDAKADDPRNGRTVRKLVVPAELQMRYDAIQSRARVNLTLNRDASGRYATDVTGLGESVRFVVSAEDFSTARRTITLVPPPTLVDLYRDEYQPAYLHHAAPALTDAERDPAGPFAKANPLAATDPQFALRGLRQAFPGKKISISSDRSVFSVPVGTELTIVAQADKPLKRVELKPVSPNVSKEQLVVPATAPFDTYKIVFDRDRPIRQVERPTEFQIVMTDTDNVSSTRTFAVTAADDAPPSVDVVVDPIVRRVSGNYFVTPVARIPFLPESKVSDDTGLSSVRFEYRKLEEEARSLVEVRAMTAASLNSMAIAPFPSWGLPISTRFHLKLFDDQFASTVQRDSTGAERLPGVSLPRFADQIGQIPRNTLDRVKAMLAAPLPTDLPPAVVKAVKLSDAFDDAFDLEPLKLLAGPNDPVQQRYKIELFVVAKDGNVELTGKDGRPAEPKSAKNLDPIRILVVSEQDLLAEIAKDEEQQMTRMEDTMKKATDAQTKLSRESALLVTPDANQILSSQVRATDILQDVAKARDILSTMRGEYDKLYREMVTNRCSPTVREKYKSEEKKNGYLDLLGQIFDGSLPKAEQSLTAFQQALAAPRKPTDEEMTAARTDFQTFLLDLTRLQTAIGVGLDLARNRQILQKLIDDQTNQGKGLKEIVDDIQARLLRPEVKVPKSVPVGVGKTAKVKVTVEWKLYAKDELYIAVEPPAESDLKLPKDLTVKSAGEEVTTVEIEIGGGTKPGLYNVLFKPGPFEDGKKVKPVELTVEVTK
jgi:hypothetical protein